MFLFSISIMLRTCPCFYASLSSVVSQMMNSFREYEKNLTKKFSQYTSYHPQIKICFPDTFALQNPPPSLLACLLLFLKVFYGVLNPWAIHIAYIHNMYRSYLIWSSVHTLTSNLNLLSIVIYSINIGFNLQCHSDLCTEQLISQRTLAAQMAQRYISAVQYTNVNGIEPK